MANADTPYGFIPLRHLSGGVIRTNSYQIATSGTTGYNDTIYAGCPVAMNTDGTIEIAAAGSTVMLGVFDGCRYTAADGSFVFSRYWPASTSVLSGSTIEAFVYDDPNITYKVQCVTGTAFTQAMVGANADHVGTSGSSTTGQCTSELAIGTLTTSDGGWRILRLIDEPNNALGEHAKVEVLCNEHLYRVVVGI